MTAPTAADLAALPFFASLPPEELEKLTGLFAIRRYPRNAIVATEGERLDLFNFILAGKINYFSRDDAGHHFAPAIEGPGGHFADGTLDGEPISMSVIALEDLRLASIAIADVKPLLLRYPQLAVALLMDVVARLRRITQGQRSLAMEDVYGRVVKLLLATAVETNGRLLTERMTQPEIGRRVGATREMVGRVLRDLTRGGYIKPEQGRMAILRKPPRRW